MKIVPAAKTKSAPKTEAAAAGNPKAQYDAEGMTTASSKQAVLVSSVPMTSKGFSQDTND